ncbi:hypothetical protein Q4Q35_01000 [Flavivirga aquimarina]|uniref:DUF3826 domain-containing protein n=1 Tax=Flavivirga aquimarina TaxID=2027862 RepID=A0ABT8W5I6_9FLAO|nr:hypothetical protein [Flavivirga aquimarina]MDO5968373.1 hypothetical protein [Flavivirga aquimarina]
MRKSILQLIVMSFLSLPIFAQQDYSVQVNLDSVKQKVASKLNKLILKYKFPKDYEKTLEINIVDYEYYKELTKYQYLNSPTIKQQKTDSLTLAFEQWRETQIQTLEKAVKLWKKVASKHDLEQDYETNYIKYHFYTGLVNPSELITTKIEILAKSNELKKIAKTIAKQETKRVLSKCSALKELDSVSINYASKELYAHLSDMVLKTLDSYSVMQLERDSDLYCSYAFDKGSIKQSEIKARKKIKENENFISKAAEAGISTDVANNILGLIEKRATDLKTRAEKIKKADGMSELFENTAVKEKSEIKKEFAENLAKLIDRKQFAKLFGEQFLPNVVNKTTEKIAQLKTTYTFTEAQETELIKMIELFHYNQEIVSAYYSFNKNVKKQKSSALRFKFQKDYKVLMESFNLTVNPAKKMDKRTYLWED